MYDKKQHLWKFWECYVGKYKEDTAGHISKQRPYFARYAKIIAHRVKGNNSNYKGSRWKCRENPYNQVNQICLISDTNESMKLKR